MMIALIIFTLIIWQSCEFFITHDDQLDEDEKVVGLRSLRVTMLVCVGLLIIMVVSL